MHFTIIIFHILLFNIMKFLPANSERLLAVTTSPSEYLSKLYRTESNRNPPSPNDSATIDASVRLRICENITATGIFSQYGYSSVPDLNEILEKLKEPRYSRIFPQLYKTTQSQNSSVAYEFTNLYALQDFRFTSIISRRHYRGSVVFVIKDYAFLCVLKQNETNNIDYYYVSKIYNFLDDRRFVMFTKDESRTADTRIMLVERSADVHDSTRDFNVELHYLALRKYNEPARSVFVDPVCKLISRARAEDNQGNRLCSIILSSAHFKDKVVHPYQSTSIAQTCFRKQILFNSEEAIEAANGEIHEERMIGCHGQIVGTNKVELFFVSRAYNPREAFVYKAGPSIESVYLDVLCTNVSIVQESYNFGVVEI